MLTINDTQLESCFGGDISLHIVRGQFTIVESWGSITTFAKSTSYTFAKKMYKLHKNTRYFDECIEKNHGFRILHKEGK